MSRGKSIAVAALLAGACSTGDTVFLALPEVDEAGSAVLLLPEGNEPRVYVADLGAADALRSKPAARGTARLFFYPDSPSEIGEVGAFRSCSVKYPLQSFSADLGEDDEWRRDTPIAISADELRTIYPDRLEHCVDCEHLGFDVLKLPVRFNDPSIEWAGRGLAVLEDGGALVTFLARDNTATIAGSRTSMAYVHDDTLEQVTGCGDQGAALDLFGALESLGSNRFLARDEAGFKTMVFDAASKSCTPERFWSINPPPNRIEKFVIAQTEPLEAFALDIDGDLFRIHDTGAERVFEAPQKPGPAGLTMLDSGEVLFHSGPNELSLYAGGRVEPEIELEADLTVVERIEGLGVFAVARNGGVYERTAPNEWKELFQTNLFFQGLQVGSIVPYLDGMLFLRRIGKVVAFSRTEGLCSERFALDDPTADNGNSQHSGWLPDGRLIIADLFQASSLAPTHVVILTPP